MSVMTNNPLAAWIDAAQRRQAVYLHLQDLSVGRDVVELWSGPADARGAELLTSRGARSVQVVAPSAKTGVKHVPGDARRSGLPNASVEVAFALDVDAAVVAEVVREARRVLKADGVLVLGVASRDRPGATSGASFYDLSDACVGFDRTRMIGVAPFAGTTLVEYGVKDPEPILDGTLVARGERVDHYLAVAGPERRGDFGYGVVQIPVASVAQVAVATPVAEDASKLREELARAQALIAERHRAPTPVAPKDEQGERTIAELRAALERHAIEMKARDNELAERDAYIAELERDGRQVHELQGRVAAAEAQRVASEGAERAARRTIAELEGKLRAGGGAAVVSDDVAVLRKKLADAEAESWKHMKARSEADAAAAELREDTVRKLKDARKLASVELMRAMEEATKKAVTLRDELTRSEAERKAALKELAELRRGESPDARREIARAKEEAEAAALAARAHATRSVGDAEGARIAAEASVRDAEERATELRGRVLGLERSLQAAEHARDEALAQVAIERQRSEVLAMQGGARPPGALAELHRDAETRGREAAEHARLVEKQGVELAKLRADLATRERELTERPARAEIDRVRGELDGLRAKVAEHTLELSRRDAAVERASASAAHERARSERLVADERQALAERNDARARMAEAVARVAGIDAERERLTAALTISEAHAHKADNDVKEKRERIRQLKRELEDAEKRAEAGVARARALTIVRARVQALETAVAGEVTRLASLESSLRARS